MLTNLAPASDNIFSVSATLITLNYNSRVLTEQQSYSILLPDSGEVEMEARLVIGKAHFEKRSN
jgi:hypothetical protein